jgi:hypothetical protein
MGLDLIFLLLAHWQKARGQPPPTSPTCRGDAVITMLANDYAVERRPGKGIIANGAANAPTR